MLILRRLSLLLYGLLLGLPALAISAELVLNPQQTDYPVGRYLEILEDPQGRLGIEDVSSPAYAERFTPSNKAIPVFSFRDSTYWLRLRITNPDHRHSRWLLEQRFANTHYLDLFLPSAGGNFTNRQAGTHRALEKRDILDRHSIFTLTIPPGSSQLLYLRVRNYASLTLDMHLLTWDAYLQANQIDNLWLGLFYGVTLIMLGYHLFLYFSIREPSYLWLCLFIASIGILKIFYDGFATFLLPTSLLKYTHLGVPMSISLSFIALLKFTQHFLRPVSTIPLFTKTTRLLIVLWLAFMILLPFITYSQLARFYLLMFIISSLFVLYQGIISWIRREPSAYLFVGGWFILMVFQSVVQFVRFGWLPSNDFTEHGVELGIMWMLLSMSLAQAHRINRLKKQANEANTVLHEREAHFRDLLESTSAIPWESDLEFRNFNLVGPQPDQLLGYPREQWNNGRFRFEHIHPEDHDTTVASYTSAKDKGDTHEFEYRMLDARGETVWIRDYVRLICENGQPVRLQGFMFDISHSKEEALTRQLTSRRFHALFEQSPLSIQILNPAGKTIQVNPAWEKLWHLRLEDLRDYNILEDQQLHDKGVMPYIIRGFSGEAVEVPAIDYNPAQTPGVASTVNIESRWFRAFIYPIKNDSGEITEIIMMHEDVSERIHALQQAEIDHERMSEAQRLAHIGSWELDLISDRLEWSDEIYRIFEVDPANSPASYQLFLDTIHPDDRERVNQAYINSVNNRKTYEIEHRLLMADGRIKHVLEHGETEYAGDGTPLRSFGTVQDITDRKRTEEAIKNIAAGVATQSRHSFYELLLLQLARTFDARYAFIGLLDEQKTTINTYVMVGDGQVMDNISCTLKNTPCEAVIKQGTYCCASRIHDSYPDITPLTELDVDSYVGTTLTDSNGQTIGILVIMDSKPIENPEIAIEILQIFSTRVAGELERMEAEKQLYTTQQRLALHIENTPLGVLEIDADFRITTWNLAASRIFGYSEEEALGKKPTDLIIPDSFLPHVEDLWQQLLQQNGGLRNTNENITKSGEIIICDWYNTPLVADDGQVFGVACLVDDVTERIQAQEELKQHRNRLEQLVEARTTQINEVNKELESFSYAVSHDLRAPLRAIDGFSAALVEDYAQALDDEARDYLDRIRNNAAYMSTLIDALLMLSRLGREKLTFKSVALHEIVQDITNKFKQNHPDQQVEFRIHEVPLTHADHRMMSVALNNLISNACKYSSRKEYPVVEFGAMQDDNGKTVYFIRDNGAGFDMQYADKLFVAFQRLHNPREYEGTGIGLATVKRIITRHGGRIWADAEKNKGATFYFTLDTENTS